MYVNLKPLDYINYILVFNLVSPGLPNLDAGPPNLDRYLIHSVGGATILKTLLPAQSAANEGVVGV